MKTTTAKSDHENVSRIPTNPPPTKADCKRSVRIGYRPVGGPAAAWTVGVLHETLKRLGNMGIRKDSEEPNPHDHWCVIVGEYYHHAQSASSGDEGGKMYYANGEISWKDGWSLFDVGETTFNDAAIAEAALSLMEEMPGVYDIWENNCHHFTIKLIDKICPPGYKEISKSTRYHRRSTSFSFDNEAKKQVSATLREEMKK